MILNDVADDTGFLVELSPSVDAETLRHRDLHVLHVATVPDRLEKRVGKPEVEDVLHRLFSEVVIDTEDRLLREELVEDVVQLLRRGQIPPEGLLDDHAGVGDAVRLSQLSDDLAEQARRNRKVMRRTVAVAELRPKPGERVGVVVVAVDVSELRNQLREGVWIEAAVLGQRGTCPLHELIEGPPRLGDADDQEVQLPAPRHGLERREDFLVGEIAACTEEDESVGALFIHAPASSRRDRRSRSAWPTVPCSGTDPGSARRSARRARRSGRTPALLRRWQRQS